MINNEILDILICPQCKVDLIKIMPVASLIPVLKCPKCGEWYPEIDDILRFVEFDSYARSFSFEWGIHKQSQLDSASGLNRAEEMFFERTGFTKEEIKDKLILDAGCGIGRFTEIVKKYGGHVVGVDLSYSVDVAKKNVPDADIIQADIHSLPFKDKSFDYVFSLGVLHHTSDTRKAFECLARLVKPGGKLAVWVYSNEGWKFKVYNAITGFYRIFTTQLPEDLLYKLSYIAVPLYYIHKIPVLGLLTRAFMATSMEENPEWRVLDTYDWYSPKYQTKHTYKELIHWFYSCGFMDVKELKVPVSLRGTKI